MKTGNTIKNAQVLSKNQKNKILGDQYVAKRKNEMFKRIKPSTLIKLLSDNKNPESIYNLAEEKDESAYDKSSITAAAAVDNNKNDDTKSIYSHKTNMTGKTGKTGISKKSIAKTTITNITYETEMLGNLADLTFILLDFREKSEYDNYHIKEAVSYPATNILRDKFTTEMYSFVRFKGLIIRKIKKGN